MGIEPGSGDSRNETPGNLNDRLTTCKDKATGTLSAQCQPRRSTCRNHADILITAPLELVSKYLQFESCISYSRITLSEIVSLKVRHAHTRRNR